MLALLLIIHKALRSCLIKEHMYLNMLARNKNFTFLFILIS